MSLEVKTSVVEALLYLARDITLKKKLMCNKVVHDLIEIILAAVQNKQYLEENKTLKMTALKCLETMGAIFNRRIYVPGDNKDLDKLRLFFMA